MGITLFVGESRPYVGYLVMILLASHFLDIKWFCKSMYKNYKMFQIHIGSRLFEGFN